MTHTHVVPENNLVGHWSERELYPSDPEFSDVVFRADGTGWMYWCSWSSEFVVERFHWQETSPGVIEVRLVVMLSGTWSVVDNVTHHEVEQREPLDTTSTKTYVISGDPLTLELDSRIDVHLGGTRFALQAREAVDPVPAHR